ncbi:ABC transporter substrate-binding protein [Spirochaetia bacterium]|nr:ABC transporter substrate-binding protein [Spirochaetia bacterium]GHU57929.1 ABC transporter substrate-binding protein [Spirochaetia bacterium]
MKKVMLLAALCCIGAALYAGGGAAKGGASDDPRYPITISVFTMGNRQQPNANNKVYQYIREKLGVTFSWDILVGEIAQKRGVMIAGGDYPDIIEISETQFIDAGALIPLEDLIEQYAPNLKKKFGDTWDKLRSPDGHIYYLTNWGVYNGRNQSPYYGDSALWVQKEILKDAGYPKVVTMDQYFDLLINYAKKYPTINGQKTIPFTILTYDWHAFCLWNPPNFLGGYPNEGNGTVDPVTHQYKNFFTQDISKRWFKKLNELNAQGYIDQASFTDNYDQYLAKISSGRVLGVHDQRWQFQNGDDALRDQGMYNRTMAPLPIVFDENIRPRYRNIPIPNLGRGIGISVKAKDPIRIVRFLDDLMTEEAQITMEWGIEGQDWQRNSKGEPYRTAQQRTNWENQTWQEQNRALLVRDTFPSWEGSFSDGYPSVLEDYYPEREALLRQEDKELWAAYGVTSFAELMDKDPPPNSLWFPTWNMANPPDGSDAQIAFQRAEQTMRKYLPQIILARPADFERLWTEYVAQMNSDGIAKYEAYMQDQLNQRIKEWSR